MHSTASPPPSPASERLLLLVLLGLLLALPGAGAVFPPLARADETVPGAEEEAERREQVEAHARRAWESFRKGAYEEVLMRLERIERHDPGHRALPYLRARVLERQGKYEEALAAAGTGQQAHPEDRLLEGARFSLLLALGRLPEANAAARAALAERPDDLVARTALGLALEEVGRRGEALEAYDRVVAAHNAGETLPEERPWVAVAAIRATRLSENPADDLLPGALRLVERHLKDHPEDQDAVLIKADLFQEDRGPQGQSRAARLYKEILDQNSEVPEARVGLARTLLVFYQQDRAVAQLEAALRTNPRFVPALALLAAIQVGDGDYEPARQHLDRALAVSPRDKQTRSVLAALHWIRGEEEAYRAVEQDLLAQDPHHGRFYVTISMLVGERQRRYDVAAHFARKAIETDANDPLGYVVLGEALMNLGQTAEAKAVFRESIPRAKRYKDVKRDNWLEVLDFLDRFQTHETEHFRVRVHASEAAVLVPYLLPVLEEAWETLTTKYGFVPAHPVHVDTFHDRDDFSVRSVGVKGLPALGVCFGGVITLLGPTSLPVGAFSWSRTAWHEFAHVVTLHGSQGQVPRWLTEGLSVYEEKARRPQWGREMDRDLFDRHRNGRLLSMAEINSAFRTSDILFAYFQGGLIAEHLTEAFGFEVIPRMLEAFAADRSTEEVFRDVLGIELADYDARFQTFVEGLVGGYRMVPRWDEKSLTAFGERVRADPSDVEAWVKTGFARLQRGQSIDAGTALDRARALAPERADVILLQGRLAQANRRPDLARAAYERFLAAGEDDLDVRLFLAGLEGGPGGDAAKAIEHLEAAKRCFPRLVGRQSPYRQLAVLYRGAGETDKAVAELRAYAAIAAEDYAVRKELKTWHKGRGEHEEVARLCEEMIDISPFGAPQGEPPDLDLHRDHAEALLAMDRKEEAVRELGVQVELVRMLPEAARAAAGEVPTRLLLGNLHLEAGRPLDALEQAVAALRLSPDDAGARILKQRAEEAAGYR